MSRKKYSLGINFDCNIIGIILLSVNFGKHSAKKLKRQQTEKRLLSISFLTRVEKRNTYVEHPVRLDIKIEARHKKNPNDVFQNHIAFLLCPYLEDV